MSNLSINLNFIWITESTIAVIHKQRLLSVIGIVGGRE